MKDLFVSFRFPINPASAVIDADAFPTSIIIEDSELADLVLYSNFSAICEDLSNSGADAFVVRDEVKGTYALWGSKDCPETVCDLAYWAARWHNSRQHVINEDIFDAMLRERARGDWGKLDQFGRFKWLTDFSDAFEFRGMENLSELMSSPDYLLPDWRRFASWDFLF